MANKAEGVALVRLNSCDIVAAENASPVSNTRLGRFRSTSVRPVVRSLHKNSGLSVCQGHLIEECMREPKMLITAVL